MTVNVKIVNISLFGFRAASLLLSRFERLLHTEVKEQEPQRNVLTRLNLNETK